MFRPTGFQLGIPDTFNNAHKAGRNKIFEADGVHIATPPHWHGIIAADAARAGKDIWCEKPLSRTIAEGEAVKAAVAEHKRIFRLNTWFRFDSPFYGMGVPVKPIKKLVQAEAFGWPLKITLGGKTGFISKAGYCLATLLRLPQSNHQVAVVVLGAGSNNGRFWETRHLFNWLADKASDVFAKEQQQEEK